MHIKNNDFNFVTLKRRLEKRNAVLLTQNETRTQLSRNIRRHESAISTRMQRWEILRHDTQGGIDTGRDTYEEAVQVEMETR